ncbi:MAG: hypothetical protein WCI03_10025 [bacterium]
MVEKHQLIKEKLKKYPPEVQALAARAFELSQSLPESAVAEQLKGIVRQVIKDKETPR